MQKVITKYVEQSKKSDWEKKVKSRGRNPDECDFYQNFFPLFPYDINLTVNHNHRKVATDTQDSKRNLIFLARDED